MQVRFNPTGTHIHKDLLKVRLDIYPDKSCLTYKQQYVYVPVIPEDVTDKQMENPEWVASLPHIWQLNPMLLAFVTISETTTLNDMLQFCEQRLTPEVLATLDASLVLPDAIHRRANYFKDDRLRYSTDKVTTKDTLDLIANANQRFSSLSLSKITGKGRIVEPGSITVGDEAIGRGNSVKITTTTTVTKGNPANADGTVTDADIWLASKSGVSDVWIGLFSASGNTLTVGDSESVGDVAEGSKQSPTGLKIACVKDNYIGTFDKGNYSYLEEERSGGSGTWIYFGECIDKGDSKSFAARDNYIDSLGGTGTESGAPPTFIPNYIGVI